eukprot:TRINITY_DN6126_c0_g1_i1.p1 TRINITY_DN6126_c0_g1~~TRINITY_DN6126_c0_g1_i1.p1  ORF type:complete len:242 (+),score=59.03 TRINITY_DN6126_c0_g1_i1:121-846(+)
MDPSKFKEQASSIVLGSVMAAAARDYKEEILKEHFAKNANSLEDQNVGERNDEWDVDELENDPELERLHADRLETLRKEAEQRDMLKKQGYGEYRDVAESAYLSEVCACERAVCHFYHRDFDHCRILDDHLRQMAARHITTKFIRANAEEFPFFVQKLNIRVLPCLLMLRGGKAVDRIVGFDGVEGASAGTLSAAALEKRLRACGVLLQQQRRGDDEEDTGNVHKRSISRGTLSQDDDDED